MIRVRGVRYELGYFNTPDAAGVAVFRARLRAERGKEAVSGSRKGKTQDLWRKRRISKTAPKMDRSPIDQEGRITFGRLRGVLVVEAAENHPSYFRWMCDKVDSFKESARSFLP
jgi:hypothetical protein